MSEDSIFIMKVEQYSLETSKKKTFLLFIINVRKFWGGEKKTKK